MKKLFIIFLIFLAGCSNNIGKKESLVEKEVKNIKASQELNKNSRGKYKHVPKTKVDNEEIEVMEYETAKGEVGYQIIYYKNGQAYKSEATGVESESRTWENNIEKIIETSSSTYEITK